MTTIRDFFRKIRALFSNFWKKARVVPPLPLFSYPPATLLRLVAISLVEVKT